MSDNKCRIVYGFGVTAIPEEASKKIISGGATLADIRVLLALCSEPALSGCMAEETVAYISEKTGLVGSMVENALAFWRGCGAVDFTECDTSGKLAKTETVTEKLIPPEVDKKLVKSKDIPTYSATQLSELLDRDGGKMKDMVDQCEQLLGRMFNAVESSALVGLCDWLGLDPEFIVTMTAYYSRKKPGCNIRYLEKAATDLVNNGITGLAELDIYLREMELYDGVAGKIRSWLGIGERAYTKKENGFIKRWVKELSYDESVIRYAYEITVDNKGEFIFDYANKILENWFASGVKTLADAEKMVENYKLEKESAPKDGGSFDTDEFFNLALKRSYNAMKAEEN